MDDLKDAKDVTNSVTRCLTHLISKGNLSIFNVTFITAEISVYFW